MSEVKKRWLERLDEFNNKPITKIDTTFIYEMRFELAKAKRNKTCTWCSKPYKLKDFRTRKDKDERDLSGMCQICIDATFGGGKCAEHWYTSEKDLEKHGDCPYDHDANGEVINEIQ
jgi:hypothetical protein|tara:strand:- start:7 stop:357 length:351 start_codon:yes stop_codon:yes gene_type:complete